MKYVTLKYGVAIPRRSLQVLTSIVVALFLIATFAPGFSSAAEKLYLSDILEDAKPDPAFKSKHFKTRRDVLPGVKGPETWVEHYILGDATIETLSYNNLTYGVIVKKGGDKVELYNLNDDKKTYSISADKAPESWLATGPNYDYNEIVKKAEGYVLAQHYKTAIEYIENAIDERGDSTGNLYFLLAQSYDGLDEVEYGVVNYKRAVELNLKNEKLIVALRNLGIILRDLNRHKEAAGYLERYLVLVPNDPNASNIRKYIKDYK
jgi:tetratricopeptide (TPR) repeat protein